MTSLRHNPEPESDAVLDAARAAILAVGWRRITLTDIARRAGVSRMTLYRRWPDMRALLADLMYREWTAVVPETALAHAGDREHLAGSVAAGVAALRDNDLFAKIRDVDPELLLPYLLDRRGRTQDTVLALLEGAIAAGQRAGWARAGDARLMARALLLAAHGFALSARTMTDDGAVSAADLDGELRRLTERYLAP